MAGDQFVCTCMKSGAGDMCMRSLCHTSDARVEGFSLVAVLWIVLAIAAVLTPLTLAARTQTVHIAMLHQADRLNYLADGIALILVAQQKTRSTDGEAQQRHSNSTVHRCRDGEVVVMHSLQNHAGLVNLNRASKSTLSAAFAALGKYDSEADLLADRVVDFRSHSSSDPGASTKDFKNGPKRAPFESVAELYDIVGAGDIPLQMLRQTFSVHSNSSVVDLQAAPPQLKKMLTEQNASDAFRAGANAQPSPMTVSVVVRRGTITGQFNGVFAKGSASGGIDRLVENWRYDDLATLDGQSTLGSCSALFGSEFRRILEQFG
ncbi:hypothetical protein [Hoeflea poritis]|uniref:General secretion pathway protein GspK n=1 Tax=Hoeflea poritis TaxID=2993659 RepID=A0ABT4VVU4_9HYPH|nr:hypothetical protein [Hoeflea poritis]MDA4848840.1 hypothetical protein [Hoeflea poritis]